MTRQDSSTPKRSHFRLGQGILSAIASFLLFSPMAWGAMLTQWSFDETLGRLEVTLDTMATPRYTLLSDPPRIALDFEGTTLGDVTSQQSYNGIIEQITVSEQSSEETRMILELSPNVKLAEKPVRIQRVATPSSESRWLIHLNIKSIDTVENAVEGSSPPPDASTTDREITIEPTPQPLPVIEFGQPLPGEGGDGSNE